MGILTRRHLGALLATSALARPALAQSDYPSRPVRVVVPYGPGGEHDGVSIARRDPGDAAHAGADL